MAQSPTNPGEYISCLKVEGRGEADAFILIVTTNEERTLHVSRIFFYQNFPTQEGTIAVSLDTWLVDFTVATDGTIISISADGVVWSTRGGDPAQTKLSRDPLTKICGPLDSATIATVGFHGRAFRQDGDTWTDLNYPDDHNLYDVTALSNNDIYVCGAGGVFAHYDGVDWTQIDLPTNRNLHTVTHNADGRVVVAGNAGIIFVGSLAAGFEETSAEEVDIHGSCVYRGRFVLASPGYGCFALDGTTVSEFQRGFEPFRITANGRHLLAAEDARVVLYDGSAWRVMDVF
ncbi:hypothetical protein SAMN02927900_05388 [Rhizobium mongolense subsp. loessense]|uniref:Uncharacterized protein n=1 Tax=Rhizobium mongolense subsp. loessense TaxID=158890 RepID=A0A1G4TMX7_9HYPH|nr:hypothetical protein [Rhizobium mongolense]SCW82780.1 hypothetical protein SAMN02927900_05388 [Rhizobium mongolense subsp. loessense]